MYIYMYVLYTKAPFSPSVSLAYDSSIVAPALGSWLKRSPALLFISGLCFLCCPAACFLLHVNCSCLRSGCHLPPLRPRLGFCLLLACGLSCGQLFIGITGETYRSAKMLSSLGNTLNSFGGF